MDEQTGTHTIDLEPGQFLRADGERTDNEAEAERYDFRAAIFTDGEASDGDIIDMRTLQIDADMPFFAQHMADATTQLGTLRGGKVTQGMRAGGRGLEAVWTGSIDLTGVGDLREVRQDVAHRMGTGELKRFSGRWGHALDGSTKVTRRVNLAKGHAAFVDGASADDNDIRRHGNYWENAHTLEGSIVGLGADPGATARTPALRAFYQKCSDAEQAEEVTRKLETPLGVLEMALKNARDEGVTDESIMGLVQKAREQALKPLSQLEGVTTLNDLSALIRDTTERLDSIQESLDDLHLADEPARVEGEPNTDEAETLEGVPKPLDAEGLRGLLNPADTAAPAQPIGSDALRRALGKPTP